MSPRRRDDEPTEPAGLDDPDAPIYLHPTERRPYVRPQMTGPGSNPARQKEYEKEITREALMTKIAAYLAIGVTNQHTLAEKLGISQQRVFHIMESLKTRWSQTNETVVSQMRHKQQLRLDLVFAALWGQVQQGDTRAIREFVRACEREAALWGLDMPIKIAPTTPAGNMLDLASILGIATESDLPGQMPAQYRDHIPLPVPPSAPLNGIDDLINRSPSGESTQWEVLPDPPSLAERGNGHDDADEDDDWKIPTS